MGMSGRDPSLTRQNTNVQGSCPLNCQARTQDVLGQCPSWRHGVEGTGWERSTAARSVQDRTGGAPRGAVWGARTQVGWRVPAEHCLTLPPRVPKGFTRP